MRKAMTQPAKTTTTAPKTPVGLKQQAVSNFFGSASRPHAQQQTSIMSFFGNGSNSKKRDSSMVEAAPNTPPTPNVPGTVNGSSMSTTMITPLAASFSLDSDDLRGIPEDEIIRPAAKMSVKSSRVILDDEEDPCSTSSPLEDQRIKASPLVRRAKQLTSAAAVPASPISKGTDSSAEDGRYGWLIDVKDANGNRPGNPDYDPRTLFIPPSAWSKFTPFEKQFWEIKSKLMDTVVFFKKGKFYELYEGDADVGAQLFDLKMTDRINMRMVGVPEATFDWWAGKFVAAGHKIARVDQTETSISKGMKDRESKGTKAGTDKIIKRELTTILTAGTLVDPGLLTSDLPTYCLSLSSSSENKFGVAFVDASTANFYLSFLQDDSTFAKLVTLLLQIRPKEILIPRGRIEAALMKLLKDLLPDSSIIQLSPDKEFWDASRTTDEIDKHGYFSCGWPEALTSADPIVLSAFGGLAWYLRELKLDKSLISSGRLEVYDPVRRADRMILDGQTLANLEILVNSGGTMKGTLFAVLDHCCTPFGRRLLRLWVTHPLQDLQAINQRLDMVDYLLSDPSLLNGLAKELQGLPDLERILSRVFAGSAKVKDFLAVLDALQKIHGLFGRIKEEGGLVGRIMCGVPDFHEQLGYFSTAFDHDLAKREGNIVPATGVNEMFDRAAEEFNLVQSELAGYLKSQQTILGCTNLRYKDLGKELYQLEVPSNITKVPSEYCLMSKTKAVNRYWTPTIKDLVRRFQEAEVRRTEALQNIFIDLLRQFSQHASVWRKIVMVIGELDCLLSLARCSASMSEPKCRPQIIDRTTRSVLEMTELRHPCIPAEKEASFIPNTIQLGQNRMLILTGPNMGGKSTLLRQTCLATIMAQIGCYVPASSARLTPVDRIFTRLGANDNILTGQSTFMVELTETSRILHEATNRSLVILDELGRGTSTFDGLAIAQASLAYLLEHVRCLGLFATHYRQLAVDFDPDPSVQCAFMACDADQTSKKITFLYKLTPGISPKSYGMNVASLAGLPRSIIDEAELVANQFEACLSISQHKQATTINVNDYKAIDLFKLLLLSI